MISKEELCRQIRKIYPDVGTCGMDVTAEYDHAESRWTVWLKKEGKELKTYLEPGDAEACMMGRECLGLAVEIRQLQDSIARMPTRENAPASEGGRAHPGQEVCQKAPEFAEHYRMEDTDAPCDDGRGGG